MFNKCSICLDNIESEITLNCFHNFCNYCLNKWIIDERKNNCPICRDEIKSINLNKKKKIEIEKYIKYIVKNKYINSDNIHKDKIYNLFQYMLGITIGISSIYGICFIYKALAF
jgi:hypothetical protein